jgi:hypothetical protein
MSQWIAHEVGHAIGYLARHPDKVHRVIVTAIDDYAEVRPHFKSEQAMMDCGISLAVNWLLGSLAERIYQGERNVLERFTDVRTKWIEALLDTKHGSQHDWDCFRMTVDAYGRGFPTTQFVDELLIAEQLIERYLPRFHLQSLHDKLKKDGFFVLLPEDLTKTVH